MEKSELKFLHQGLQFLEISIDNVMLDMLERYHGLLIKWNKTFNLTGLKNPADWWIRHFLDSLAVVKFLNSGNLADVGSGAGFPGLPIAIVCPKKAVTLIEINQKKSIFLREVCNKLGLTNCTVVRSRVQEYKPVDLFSCVISRAFADLSTFFDQAKSICKGNGILMAMKGKICDREKLSLPPGVLNTIVELQVPYLHESRNLVLMNSFVQKPGERDD